MAQITISELEQFLAAYGWKHVRPDDNVIGTAFALGERGFDLNIYLIDEWVQIEILNLARSLPLERESFIYDSLLTYTGEMVGCKLAIDVDGSVSLIADLAGQDLVYDTFAETLDLLTAYSERYFPQIAELCGETLSGENNTTVSP